MIILYVIMLKIVIRCIFVVVLEKSLVDYLYYWIIS